MPTVPRLDMNVQATGAGQIVTPSLPGQRAVIVPRTGTGVREAALAGAGEGLQKASASLSDVEKKRLAAIEAEAEKQRKIQEKIKDEEDAARVLDATTNYGLETNAVLNEYETLTGQAAIDGADAAAQKIEEIEKKYGKQFEGDLRTQNAYNQSVVLHRIRSLNYLAKGVNAGKEEVKKIGIANDVALFESNARKIARTSGNLNDLSVMFDDFETKYRARNPGIDVTADIVKYRDFFGYAYLKESVSSNPKATSLSLKAFSKGGLFDGFVDGEKIDNIRDEIKRKEREAEERNEVRMGFVREDTKNMLNLAIDTGIVDKRLAGNLGLLAASKRDSDKIYANNAAASINLALKANNTIESVKTQPINIQLAVVESFKPTTSDNYEARRAVYEGTLQVVQNRIKMFDKDPAGYAAQIAQEEFAGTNATTEQRTERIIAIQKQMNPGGVPRVLSNGQVEAFKENYQAFDPKQKVAALGGIQQEYGKFGMKAVKETGLGIVDTYAVSRPPANAKIIIQALNAKDSDFTKSKEEKDDAVQAFDNLFLGPNGFGSVMNKRAAITGNLESSAMASELQKVGHRLAMLHGGGNAYAILFGKDADGNQAKPISDPVLVGSLQNVTPGHVWGPGSEAAAVDVLTTLRDVYAKKSAARFWEIFKKTPTVDVGMKNLFVDSFVDNISKNGIWMDAGQDGKPGYFLHDPNTGQAIIGADNRPVFLSADDLAKYAAIPAEVEGDVSQLLPGTEFLRTPAGRKIPKKGLGVR